MCRPILLAAFAALLPFQAAAESHVSAEMRAASRSVVCAGTARALARYGADMQSIAGFSDEIVAALAVRRGAHFEQAVARGVAVGMDAQAVERGVALSAEDFLFSMHARTLELADSHGQAESAQIVFAGALANLRDCGRG